MEYKECLQEYTYNGTEIDMIETLCTFTPEFTDMVTFLALSITFGMIILVIYLTKGILIN